MSVNVRSTYDLKLHMSAFQGKLGVNLSLYLSLILPHVGAGLCKPEIVEDYVQHAFQTVIQPLIDRGVGFTKKASLPPSPSRNRPGSAVQQVSSTTTHETPPPYSMHFCDLVRM